ncbi:MAG: hypothetical protein K6F51_05045 [Acetatifactor sp.]|nr:hypothetical protein [Acetatifactor sp.]
MKKCIECGRKLSDDVKTCLSCGSTSFMQIDSDMKDQKDDLKNKFEYATPNAEKANSEQVSDQGNILTNTDRIAENGRYRILEIIGGILCIVGIFLPFIRASFLGSVVERTFSDLAPNDYVIFLVVAIVGVAGAFFEKHKLAAFAGIAYAGLLYIDTESYFKDLNEKELGQFVTKGIGFYCMVAGIILLIVVGGIADNEWRKRKKNN